MNYDALPEEEKNKYAARIAGLIATTVDPLLSTDEEGLASIINDIRKIGSSDLINRISDAKDPDAANTKFFPKGLRERITSEFTGGDEDRFLGALGYASDDKVGDSVDVTAFKKEGVAVDRSNYSILGATGDFLGKYTADNKTASLGKGEIPSTLTGGLKKMIKAAAQNKKQSKAPVEPTKPQAEKQPAPTKDQPVSKLPAPIDASSSTMLGEAMGGGGGFAPAATPPRGGLPQSVLNIIHGGKAPYQKDATDPLAPTTETKETKGKQLGPTRELAKTLKAATPAATGGSSGSGTGLDYLRSREERKQRDKAGKADIAEEQIAGRTRAEGRFSGMKREILAQQAERDRITKEKSDANKIAIEGAGGKEELLGRVIRDKSGKVIGHSTTSAGRRALGDPYKGVKGGAMDFDKPAESYAELDMRDAAKQRMGSKQQQVMDLWSKGASSEQRKQIAPLREGLGVDPDKIQPFEGAGKTKLDIDATVNEGFHTSDEVAKAPKMELSPKPQNMPNIGREDPMIPQAKPREVESVGSRLQREEGERSANDLRNKQLKPDDLGLAFDKERGKQTKAVQNLIRSARAKSKRQKNVA